MVALANIADIASRRKLPFWHDGPRSSAEQAATARAAGVRHAAKTRPRVSRVVEWNLQDGTCDGTSADLGGHAAARAVAGRDRCGRLRASGLLSGHHDRAHRPEPEDHRDDRAVP